MLHSKLDSLAVVAPFFNEQLVINEFYTEVTNVLDNVGIVCYFVFVDDGSDDATLTRLNRLADDDPRITVVSLARNFGHQMALTAGLDFVSAEVDVVTMDSDLQHPPETILKMIDAYNQGYSVVYGIRREDSYRDWSKRLTSHIYHTLFRRIANVEISEGAAEFRLMSREVVTTLQQMRETHQFLRGMVPWIGFDSTTVEFEQARRVAGSTKYTWRKLLQLARSGLFSFSVVPLNLITYLGLLLTTVSALYFVFVLGAALFTNTSETIPGWLSQTILILLLGGVQLISLGTIAQYVGMIFEQVKERPLYTVKQVRRGTYSDDKNKA